ncbi:MAG: hypothetical protein ACI9J3_000309 [Parvicellaceae bacterium]|jgi:hypothetical protein
MRYLTTLVILFSSAGFMAQSGSESDATPKYSNEFLQIGVGARSLGMSNSVIATTTDITAGYWNPAGLLHLNDEIHVGLMHAEYFAGLAKYDYGSFAKRIDSVSAFGISMIRFGVDDIPNTTELIDAEGNIDYDKITTFSAADYGFLFSYARKIKGIEFGGNAKIIHRKVGSFGKSWGFGIDLSARYEHKDWQFGATFRDITTTFNAWSYTLNDQMIETFTLTGNEIPSNSIEITLPRLLLGVARSFKIKEKFSILPEVGLDITFDGKRNTLIKSNFASIDPHLGIEFGYNGLVFLRTGIGNMQYILDVTNNETLTFQPNIGIGVKIKRIAIDYALTDLGNASAALYSNIFSLKFDVVKPTN